MPWGTPLWASRALTEARLGGRVASLDPRLWGPGPFPVAKGLQLVWAVSLKPRPGPGPLCTPGSLSAVPQGLC